MKKRICILMTVLLLAVCGAAAAEAAPTKITVLGSGEVSALPDMVSVTVNASITAPTMLEAQMQVSDIVEKTTRALTELGIAGADIITANYGYNPMYSYTGETRVLIGYQASHTLDIICRDILLLDSVINAVTECGMTDIYNVSYDVADRGALYARALELAVRAAEEKAVAMAAASGKTITGLLTLTENQSYDSRYAYKGVAMAEGSALNAGIRAGAVSVQASISAMYGAQ